MDVPGQVEKILPFLHTFVLFEPTIDWVISTLVRLSSLFSLLIQMLISRNTLTDTARNNIFFPAI